MPILENQKENFNIWEWITLVEGSLNQIYGGLGSGKTYMATRMILSKLQRGEVVYSSWPVKWEGYDQRKNKWLLLLGVLGLKRHFYFYPKENLKRISYENFFEVFKTLTSCSVFLDEGHIVFDSYKLTRMDMNERLAVLDTRHYDREVWVISQRPTAIHASLRGNVNRFFKCEAKSFWRWTHFTLSEFDELDANEKPDETREPINQISYWGRKKYFESYDTKYRRGNSPESQENLSEIWRLKWFEKIKLIFKKNV